MSTPSSQPEDPNIYARMLGVALNGLVNKHIPSTCPDRDKVTAILGDFVLDAIHKYSQGFHEHGGSIMDRNISHDTRQEVIDLLFYTSFLTLKLELYTRRLGGL